MWVIDLALKRWYIIFMNAYVLKVGRKAHGVRNRQSEYISHEGKSVVVLEMFCGRKAREDEVNDAQEVTCGTCVLGVRKASA